MDLFDQLGELALGSRLKRLSDGIMKDGVKIYQNNNIDFEPKHFPIFYLLSKKKSLAIMEISETLGVSHPSVIQSVKEMEKKKLIHSHRDQEDGRKRLLSLTATGKSMIPLLQVVWEDVAAGIHELISSQENNLLEAISGIEKALTTKSLSDRVALIGEKRKLAAIEIVDYKDIYGEDFKKINYWWIKKYFTIEDIDREVLDHHKTYILDHGGHILFAKYQEKIVGTCALIKETDDRYELSKMGVLEGYQGMQIGKKLGLAIIEKAKTLGAKTLYLDTNKTLIPAIRLYEKLGFSHVHRKTTESVYQRSDVCMELDLKP